MDDAKRAYIVRSRLREIDPRIKFPEYQYFVKYLDDFCPGDDHYFRYCNTFALMLESGLNVSGKVVMETGHPSPITRFMPALGASATGSKGDLRYTIEAPSASVDVLLSFEVMEHIKDQTERSFDDIVLFNESGVRRFAAEIGRVLKPGGVLYLTTPNACSLYSTIQILENKPPVLFRPHVREYSREEVEEIFGDFTVESYKSHYSLFYLSSADRAPYLKRYFADLGFSADDRGDLHFFKFIKPLVPS